MGEKWCQVSDTEYFPQEPCRKLTAISGRHFVNDVTDLVRRALCNVARGAPDLCVRLEERSMERKGHPLPNSKVV
jgi:hypothetical protein